MEVAKIWEKLILCRYAVCWTHEGLYMQLMKEESRPRILEWLRKQPQTYDIRQKIAYFEQGAAGNRKKRQLYHVIPA